MTSGARGEGGLSQSVQGVSAARPDDRATFGRDSFSALWTPEVLGGGVGDLGKELAAFIVIGEAGVCLSDHATGGMQWSPGMHANAEPGYWRNNPALPFPFTPGDLAAFMLNGPGRWLGEAFGGLDQPSPDLSALAWVSHQQAVTGRVVQLLSLVWDAYRTALNAVGPRPVDPADAASHGDDAASGVDQAGSDAAGPVWSAEAEHTWIRAMCRRLLDQPEKAALAGQVVSEEHEPARESKEQRQERRYRQCVEAGMAMPTDDYAHLPRGIKLLAEKEGITRQSYSEDVKAHIRRLNGR